MKLENFSLLNGVTGATTGNPVNVSYYERMTASVYSTGTTSATAYIQGAIDSNWYNIASATLTNTTGFYAQLTGPWNQIRAVVNPHTSGTFFANLKAGNF